MATYKCEDEHVSARKREMRSDLLLRMFEIHSYIRFKHLIVSVGRGAQIKRDLYKSVAAFSKREGVLRKDKISEKQLSDIWSGIWAALENNTYDTPQIKMWRK